jgi:antitoxin FitA
MSKMIQVRNVPEELHRELTRRAKLRGLTLTDYLQQLLEQEVSRPMPEEVFARIRTREPVELPGDVAEVLRVERAERKLPDPTAE